MSFLSKKYFYKPPHLGDFPLKTYSVNLPLDRLVLGADNIHIDVHLSQGFCSAASKIAIRLISRHANAEHILRTDKTTNWFKERDEFKRLCQSIMTMAINKAKMGREIQIDYLVQVAIVKVLTKLIREQFDRLIDLFNEVIRIHELSDRENLNKAIQLKGELTTIYQQKGTILFNAGRELFGYLMDVQIRNLNEVREANFGAESMLSEDLFTNPMLLVDDPTYDFFMIEEYDILLGHRLEDPDKYETFLFSLRSIFKELSTHRPEPKSIAIQNIRTTGTEESVTDDYLNKAHNDQLDGWINQLENIDILLNYFRTRSQYQTQKKRKWDPSELKKLHNFLKGQKKVLNFFYKKLKKTGLVKRIAAYYEIKPVYHEYCPPLRPQQVMQFLTSSKQRRKIINQLNRLKGFYARPFVLKPLLKRINNLGKIKTQKKKEYLVQFLKGFARYHRDYLNFNLLKQTMENVNVVSDEKIINLSRANNTLYEFLLSHEEVLVEKPIINHVIIKADVRGSTDITYQMKEGGLNPASYFSLNFFDPITDILPAYGAVKVFIEGDAFILAIYEKKDTPGEWYNVARACGLAINTLFIVKRYNINSSKYNLPILELGIGICFEDSSPAYLFDGNQRIMISPAINIADRLSACTKSLSRLNTLTKGPFNLYVFQNSTTTETLLTADDTYLRYNVNGIELNADGFKKLSEEIDLKVMGYKTPNEEYMLYTCKFPTVSGKFQRLIIREAHIPIVDPSNLQITGLSPKKYYEVCTNEKLYEYAREKD